MNRIKQLRESKNITQLQLAQKLSKTQQTVSLYENGINEPDIDSYIILSKLFDCSIEYIAGKSNIKNPTRTVSSSLNTDGLEDEDLKELQKQIDYIKKIKNRK